MFTKYGYNTMGIVLFIVFILIVISIFSSSNYIRVPLILLAFLLAAFTINFFRDPERKVPEKSNIVVSPADGRVLFVKDVIDEKFINGRAKMVSIFMSPLNVHVNRIPISGKVEYLNYVKGNYIAAFEDKASEQNERNEIGINSSAGKVLFIQIAGFIARRIISEVKVGDSVTIGNRFGMIKFGSRVDIIVPEQWFVKVKKDDNVTAGETILFEY
ncbi:MAG TPA: phosphatidylserine decarboxylase family protein [Ignavibacteriaceae bacterium]|jgi:phosphatidylserine decarboxylase|nr:MAG: phosphatidylserine decarboxylase [Ignavibacteria bacterium ADurb.Bin266]OQY73251.1 MAG: phosphatidylserine decarboxylase [Ignavibacteriales bacterium UTCHB2]HQF42205.1 phosphatidylserine decarboxylase family protein [Ignavibacteriaceae bacterium]HQI42313.1 phosphatidylserine decarboxylase family protein [Ignavibacteriaceae bacterium]